METLKTMGFATTMQVGMSFLCATLHKRPNDNLENYYINSFGKKLYGMFFEGYTEKLWGRHPREIDASWGKQRTKELSIMGKALEKQAGGQLQKILSKLTDNPLKGFFLGLCVTAVIQSSSATTVMVVGFVNSGIMELHQAIGVIMGSNVGTTVTSWILSLSGLQGGHSGAEIDKGRGNAVQLMGRALYGAMEQVGALRIADLRGGQFDNVICPRCDAVVAVPAGKEEEFTSFVRKFDRIMKNELSVADGGVTLSCAAVSGTAAYDADASARMLHALLVMPQGVQVMSPDFPGLVQTSQNLGVITAEDDGLRFSLSIRSSVASEKEMLLQKVRAIVTFAGGTVSTRGDYPAWQYARQSPLRDTVMAAYKRVTGKDGVALAIHAGLECGLLAGKMPGLDAVSFGPELLDIHSPRERLGVASVERMYQLVCEILKNCR